MIGVHTCRSDTVLTTLFALMAEMVGNAIPVKLAIVADANSVRLALAIPYKKL
jgi:hypothetical protein